MEQDFNSLDAQREACEAYIGSQKHEGWDLLPDRYDDGGISGGHLDRPALQQLMQALDHNRIDQILVYKIDRLTRSLADFAKLVERLDEAEAPFVSVTQSFNTATSMGRLTLNVLLSFAQLEREVTAERIRDKIVASKRYGLWMGGNVPLGYQVDGRTLNIDPEEAATIRTLYELYLEHGLIRVVKQCAEDPGLSSRKRVRRAGRISGGKPFDRGHIHHILSNPIYAGRIRHKGQVYGGQHPAIIQPEVWDKVQQMLQDSAAKTRGTKRETRRSPLVGKLFDETGDRLTLSHSRKNGKRLRYYISHRLVKNRRQKHPDAWRLPAEALEALNADLIRKKMSRPDFVATLMPEVTAAEIAGITTKLQSVQSAKHCLALVSHVDLKPGQLIVALNDGEIAKLVGSESDRLDATSLSFQAPFRMRRSGVELKLHLGDAPGEVDRTLVQNVVKAQKWLAMIID